MKKLIPFLLLFFALNVFSQKEANFWYFGRNAGLDFTSGAPVALTDGALSTAEGSATISDKNGVLLFYTDGSTVYNKDHQVMVNGTGLLGDSSSAQSAIIVPKPQNENIYYIFTVDRQSNTSSNGVKFSEVDITLNGGLGEVTIKNTDLNDSRDAQEKITSVKGDECNTFWVITGDGNEFQSYKIDDTGVNTTANSRSPYIRNLSGRRGYLKISPDGKTLVNASINTGSFIYDFNDLTGEITNGGELEIPDDRGYGVEFSRDSQKLYISTGVNDQGATATNANIYQFNLENRNITTLNNSRELIANDNSGFRGALQLAPNGKIYYSRSSTTFLGVINSPENDAKLKDVGYDPEGISLDGRFASEGLPPFIQSFFSIVEIVDEDTNQTINNEDLQFCVGDTKKIIPNDPPAGLNPPSYKWEFDNGTSSIEINNNEKILEFNSLQKTDSGKYTLTIELTNSCGDVTQYIGTFNIGVFEPATATKPEDIFFCDLDRDGFNSFDLQDDSVGELKDKILTGLDKTLFDVVYFLNNADATSGDNPLPNPYTNPTAFSTQTIHARVQNKNAPNACFALTTFTLAVTDLPIPTQPDPYRICDDVESGDDTDEIINTFLLNTRDEEIYGALDKNQYNISYHTTQAGADTNDAATVIDKNANHSVTTAQTVFVRVENKDNASCNDATVTLELVVDPLPVVNNPAELIQCHNDPTLNTTVNLTLARPNISSNYTNETFEYYKTEADAIAGTPQITGSDRETYPVTGTGEAWVRVISNQNCYRISKIEITVNFEADLIYNKTYTECDDLLDADGNNTAANSDTDGISYFDFSDSENEIKAFFPLASRPDLDVLFYETEADRTAAINEIPDITRHRNNSDPSYANTQTIYAKIVNNTNNGCTGTAQFTLQVNAVPLANPVVDLNLCDDALSGNTTDGENININLRDNVPTILGATQSDADFIVTFHISQSDADDVTNSGIPNDTDFRNSAQAGFTVGDISEQTIFVRVLDRNAAPQCKNTSISFKILVNPIPEISTTIAPLAVCDVATSTDSDPRNRIAQNIDLTSKNIEILNGRTNHRIAYYATQQHAVDGFPEITNPNNFQNDPSQTTFPANFNTDDPGIQTIFFAVIDQGGNMCKSVFSTYQLLIYPEPNIPINISDYSDCDNTTDTDADDTNGRNGDISLKNKIPEILANYQPSEYPDFNITFYTSLTDAESGDISLAVNDSKFENFTNNQPIFVRVENTKNTPVACVHTRLSFNINIIPLPEFTVTGDDPDDPQILCLNYTTPFILEAENPAATYEYEWTDKNGTVLGTDQMLTVSTGGEYTVKATDIATTCSRSSTIYVKESEKATLLEEYVTIIDESNNIGAQENISIFIDTDKNPLGKGDYQFAIRNDDNSERTPFAGFQDEALFENLPGGIYTIIVNDKNGCVSDTELQISVIQFPKFFTPNGDGKNDTWVIKGANKKFYPNASINIFNRFGKLVAQIPIDGQGWNGTYNGKVLSSDDYWYKIQLIPADPAKSPILKTGHFSMLRK